MHVQTILKISNVLNGEQVLEVKKSTVGQGRILHDRRRYVFAPPPPLASSCSLVWCACFSPESVALPTLRTERTMSCTQRDSSSTQSRAIVSLLRH